jgi:Cu(I)/Ag(I) efflux system membrane protein CusA/SilA
MLRNENGLLSSFVYIDIADRDIGSYIQEAKATLDQKLSLPTGVTLVWSGQYENLSRAWDKMKVIIPITLIIICLLVYANTKSMVKTFIIFAAIPFSIVSGVLDKIKVVGTEYKL